MMKKVFALVLFASVICSLSAQKVKETVTVFGKEQISGFTININDATPDIVAGALADKFENQYALKGSKKKGFHVYENQPCVAFGEARYDIYFTTAEVGKKKDKTTQVTLVVSTGNLNCITFTNDPRTSRNIVTFLEKLPQDVEAYKIKLRIIELKKNLNNLEKEKQNLLKEQTKMQDKLNVTNDEIKKISEQLDAKNAEINAMQEEFNTSHDAALQDQIATANKERQSLQKSQQSKQNSLLNINNNLQKLKTKLDTNQKNTEDAEAELKSLEQQQ